MDPITRSVVCFHIRSQQNTLRVAHVIGMGTRLVHIVYLSARIAYAYRLDTLPLARALYRALVVQMNHPKFEFQSLNSKRHTLSFLYAQCQTTPTQMIQRSRLSKLCQMFIQSNWQRLTGRESLTECGVWRCLCCNCHEPAVCCPWFMAVRLAQSVDRRKAVHRRNTRSSCVLFQCFSPIPQCVLPVAYVLHQIHSAAFYIEGIKSTLHQTRCPLFDKKKEFGAQTDFHLNLK